MRQSAILVRGGGFTGGQAGVRLMLLDDIHISGGGVCIVGNTRNEKSAMLLREA